MFVTSVKHILDKHGVDQKVSGCPDNLI